MMSMYTVVKVFKKEENQKQR